MKLYIIQRTTEVAHFLLERVDNKVIIMRKTDLKDYCENKMICNEAERINNNVDWLCFFYWKYLTANSN